MRLIFDIETNGLLDELDRVWCAVVTSTYTGSTTRYGPANVAQLTDHLDAADELIGQNIKRFDLPALKKVYGWEPRPEVKITDTATNASALWPKITPLKWPSKDPDKKWDWGFHSLRAWGERLGVLKGDYGDSTDWQEYTPEMLDYCERDVEVTSALYAYLLDVGLSQIAQDLERDFAYEIGLLMDNGVWIDQPALKALIKELDLERVRLEELCVPLMPPVLTEQETPEFYLDPQTGCFGRTVGLIDKAFRARLVKTGKEWVDPEDGTAYPTKAEASKLLKARSTKGPNRVKREPGNPNSDVQIARLFKDKYDWKPSEFTPAGQPSLTAEVLRALPYDEAQHLADLREVLKRLEYVSTGENGLEKVIQEDGRVHGYVNHNGADTGRCTHSKPNTANSTSARKRWGKETRACFAVPPGRKMVGCDADGLELRVQAHYMAPYDDGAYVEKILEGDVHTANQLDAGLETRDHAKVFIYKLNYGSGDVGLAEGLPIPEEAIQHARDAWAKYGKRFLASSQGHQESQDLEWFWRLPRDVWSPVKACAEYLEKGQSPPPETMGAAVVGARLRASFMAKAPAYARVVKEIKKEAKQGWVEGIDGRPISSLKKGTLDRYVPGHKAVNFKFQSTGALVMKKATVLACKEIRRRGLDALLVLQAHDELQFDALEAHAEEVGTIVEDSIQEAGEFFGLLCPMAGSKSIGNNWSETH